MNNREFEMFKKILISCFSFFIIVLNTGCSEKKIEVNKDFVLTTQLEKSYLLTHKTEQLNVIVLQGDWKEMGRQYGRLMRKELSNFYIEISEDLKLRGKSYKEQLTEANKTYSQYSDEMKNIIIGMSETSGLSLDQHIILDASIYLLTEAIFGDEIVNACSAVAVWGEMTSDDKLLIGRNWDIDRKNLERYNKYISVAVFNPDDGNSFANIRYTGQIYIETGFNDKGLLIELNNGEQSDTSYFPERRFTGEVLFETVNKCNSLDEVYKLLRGIPGESSYIIQVADKERVVSIERPTFDTRIRVEQNCDYLVASNNFIKPYPEKWRNKILTPPSPEVDPRRNNLLATLNKDYISNKMNLELMKNIMDLDVTEGGAVHNGTVFQIIAVPEKLKLLVKITEYSDWIEINLASMFI